MASYSISEFKRRYFRFFTNWSPYQKWKVDTNYFTNDMVYFDQDFKTYKALQNNLGQTPDVSPIFWQIDNTVNISKFITETDLDNAFVFATNNLSSVLKTDADKEQGFYLLMAHYLQYNTININSTSGYAPTGITTSLSAGNVSEGLTPNMAFLNLNLLSFSKTRFGQEYMSLCILRNTSIIGLAKGGLS